MTRNTLTTTKIHSIWKIHMESREIRKVKNKRIDKDIPGNETYKGSRVAILFPDKVEIRPKCITSDRLVYMTEAKVSRKIKQLLIWNQLLNNFHTSKKL